MNPQEEFNKTYITSSEVRQFMGVSRSAMIHARIKGYLPNPISVEGQLTIWKRAFIEPYVLAWKRRREERIGVA
jgi:predicted DNA-binding transcriptional regulator AlpA